MSLHRHDLRGCAPAPLAFYLKALGILRLVAEQADPEARGWWQDEHFVLVTRLDRNALREFFLDRYHPTPLLAPWNKGSGFVFARNNPTLAILEGSTASRLASFRSGVAQARALTSELGEADRAVRALKDRTKIKKGMTTAQKRHAQGLKTDAAFKRELAAAERKYKVVKESFIPRCRLAWSALPLSWFDAALVLDQNGNPRYPALLGTGGNDGKNDFTKQFMTSLAVVFDLADPVARPTSLSASLLDGSLWGESANHLVAGLPVGQFLPGGAGGANASCGPTAESLANPWDYILMLEGALVFSAAITRRGEVGQPGAAAPFAVRASAAGYGSAAPTDESPRGEQWMPLWPQPGQLTEIRTLFAEARMRLGRRGGERPTDAVQAIARLGVARGITAFQRFGYIERNGQSNLATPLGRVVVKAQPRIDLLTDLDDWLRRLQRAANHEKAGLRFRSAVRRLDEAILALCQNVSRDRWQAVLRAAVDLESGLAASPTFTAEQGLSPIPPLDPEWLSVADDGSPEFRLALALGTAARIGDTEVDPLRRHWLPLDPKRRGRFAVEGGSDHPRLRDDPAVVATGADPLRDCIAVVRRRMVERGSAVAGFPLAAGRGCAAGIEDLTALVDDGIDLDRTVALARAVMAVDRHRLGRVRAVPGPAFVGTLAAAAALIRLVHLPWPLKLRGVEVVIRSDPGISARLAAGDLAGACELARRRLVACGLRPALRVVSGNAALAARIAASLAFPIGPTTATCLAEILTTSGRE